MSVGYVILFALNSLPIPLENSLTSSSSIKSDKWIQLAIAIVMRSMWFWVFVTPQLAIDRSIDSSSFCMKAVINYLFGTSLEIMLNNKSALQLYAMTMTTLFVSLLMAFLLWLFFSFIFFCCISLLLSLQLTSDLRLYMFLRCVEKFPFEMITLIS